MRRATLKFLLMGSGQAKVSCGDVKTVYEACSRNEDHHKKYLPTRCNDRTCPICYGPVVRREARKATERIRGIHDDYLKDGFDLGIPVHLVLSPPPATPFETAEDWEALRKTAYQYVQDIGMVGGCMPFHKYRATAKQFKMVRLGILDETDLDIGPHFHPNGFMPQGHLMTSRRFNYLTASKEEKESGPRGRNGGYVTGWTYKVIKYRIPKIETAYNVIKYELSHASFLEGKHALTWFGICSYANTRSDKKKVEVEAVCRTCKAPIAYYEDGIFLSYKVERKVVVVFKTPLGMKERLAVRYSLPRCTPRREDLLALAIFDEQEVIA